jgi:hypothetical protein
MDVPVSTGENLTLFKNAVFRDVEQDPRGVTSQDTAFFIVIAVKTSNPTNLNHLGFFFNSVAVLKLAVRLLEMHCNTQIYLFKFDYCLY